MSEPLHIRLLRPLFDRLLEDRLARGPIKATVQDPRPPEEGAAVDPVVARRMMTELERLGR